MTDQPDQPSNPIPPEGCTCGSLYSVRGEHGKKDCPYRQDVNQTTPSVDKSEMNVNSVQAQGGGEVELRELYQRTDVSNNRTDNPIGEDEFVAAIEQLITTRFRAQLDGLETDGPSKKTTSHIADPITSMTEAMSVAAIKGFNEANDQWRTLLAKKRDTL